MSIPPTSKYRNLSGTVLKIAKIIGWCALGGFLSLLGFFIYHLENRVDLSLWHKVNLDTEFTIDSKVENFEDYLNIEKQVFKQLDKLVYDKVAVGRQQLINRYSRGSVSHPERWTTNWNRTFELPAASPDAGVLLLHGMSDSPYSLRGIGQQLHKSKTWVLGLRFPGHGTAPSGLTRLRWQDMARSVELAMNHLRNKVGSKPIYIIGYSAGGALAVHYALQSQGKAGWPKATGIVLISPAIGVTSLAAFAVWQARLGHISGLDKLQWSDIKLEYDPFKYNSFAVNAGDQVFRLTEEISGLLAKHDADESLGNMPTLLAFQSSVDATVSSQALIDELFMKLPPARHELVLFDINRQTDIEQVLKNDPAKVFQPMLENIDLPFTLSIVRNQDEEVSSTSVYRRAQGSAIVEEIKTPLVWPADLYSLSHVALPFAENDTLYGKTGSSTQSGIRLGDLALRGERGVVRISPGDMLRLRWNPFYPLIEQRILDFVK